MKQGIVNPTPEQQAFRDVDRIKTLRIAMMKAAARGNETRLASLREEHDRRMERVMAVKAALSEVDEQSAEGNDE